MQTIYMLTVYGQGRVGGAGDTKLPPFYRVPYSAIAGAVTGKPAGLSSRKLIQGEYASSI